jgi:hypothetical protein
MPNTTFPPLLRRRAASPKVLLGESTKHKVTTKKIIATGRKGAGKPSFIALISRYLKPPILLVDLDPELSLADMLVFDFHKESYKLQK